MWARSFETSTARAAVPSPHGWTTNPAAFLRGRYDVVIEALGDVEPARTIVSRLLGRRVPVVTANKALIAAHGSELVGLAARRGTVLRYEASALAGVPFLGAFASRPLVSDVHRFAAVVNGTSNFILSALEHQGASFEKALAQAQALGLTEPDPSRDLDGRDAADKLTLLASLFGWGAIPRAIASRCRESGTSRRETSRSPERWTPPSSRSCVPHERTLALSAFVGPALVPTRHPLATLSGTLSGIQCSGRYISDLFFSGPGAGPDITAATILDDVAEAVSVVLGTSTEPEGADAVPLDAPPSTEWFVRARFPGLVPESAAASQLFASVGTSVLKVSDAIGESRWVKLGAATREGLNLITDEPCAPTSDPVRGHQIALTKGRFAEGRFAEGRYTEGRFAEGRFAEGRYAEGRYAEGR